MYELTIDEPVTRHNGAPHWPAIMNVPSAFVVVVAVPTRTDRPPAPVDAHQFSLRVSRARRTRPLTMFASIARTIASGPSPTPRLSLGPLDSGNVNPPSLPPPPTGNMFPSSPHAAATASR